MIYYKIISKITNYYKHNFFIMHKLIIMMKSLLNINYQLILLTLSLR